MTAAATLLLLLAFPAAEAAPSSAVATLEKRLAQAGRKTRTLTGTFVQRKRLRLFKAEVVTRGRLYYRRPDRLRWETLPPDASTLLVLGKHAELRLPGEAPRAIDLEKNRSVGVLVEQLLIWLGAGSTGGGSLSSWYDLSVEALPSEGQRLRLRPRKDRAGLGRRIREVTVEFDGTLTLRAIRILHDGGDRSRIEFEGLKRNARLPKDLFR